MSSSTANSVVCEEVFDEASHPSLDEVRDYAAKIGIDPENEPQLLPLAAEGLMRALPPGWKPVLDEKSKSYYYFNNATGKTQWEHPLDDIYRNLVRKKRTESQSLSLGEPTEDATYTRDDLPSYEEPPIRPFENLSLGARKKELKLSPLKKVEDFPSGKLIRQKSEEKPISAYVANRKIGLSLSSSFDSKPDKLGDSPKREFKLSGGGSMFLKSKSKKLESPDRNLEELITAKFAEVENLTASKFSEYEKSSKPSDVEIENEKDKGKESITSKFNEIEKNLITSKFNELEKNLSTVKSNDGGERKTLFSDIEKNQNNPTTPNFSELEKSFPTPTSTEIEEILEIKTSDEKDLKEAQPRGILRERSFIESTKSVEDDDKKNVRFNLDDDTNHDLSDKSMDDDIKIDVKLTKNKPKRFSLSPVDSSEGINLKLIKPNPLDFVKPKIKPLEGSSNAISDSEDESVLKSSDKKETAIKEDDVLKLSMENRNNITEKYREDNMAIINQLKLNADKELEDMKKTIWDEKNVEISKYKEQLQESQKNELQRILTTEKKKCEETIVTELENLRREMGSRNLGALDQEKKSLEQDLDKQKSDLADGIKLKMEEFEKKLNEDFEANCAKLRKGYAEKMEEIEKELKRELEKHKDELVVSHNAILDQLKQNHQAILDEIKKDYKSEEKIIRKEHENQISELKKKVSGSVENEMAHLKDANEERLYEKVRCEKRLLEDKYRCLKEKYLRLKTDVKLSIEKRNRKREQSATTTTGSETERSNSINKERSPHRSPTHIKFCEKPPLKSDLNSNRHKPEHKTTRTIIIQDLDTSTSDRSCKNDQKQDYDSSEENANAGRSRKKMFSRVKSSSTSRVNNNKPSKKVQRSCSPVENLRRQLQKLEDLEDQFPQNAAGDTYHLRYPFSDGQKFEGSSELEFFRHRIHLERDSIKRAKESLRTQKCLFQQRQNDLKLKHGSMARHTLQQLCQEEKDLTDMEVSLHRTRSLLGEKVIRLRHLEQSLQRATAVSNEQAKQEEATLSDLSSHSASSGISSTEFATAADGARTVLRGEHLQESSEIIQSLENLNSEIREIWEVLNQQQQAGNMASVMPLPLVYPDLGWPVLAGAATVPAPPSIPTLADRLHNYRQHVALANAQSTVVTHAANQGATTTLVERTRNLRHWLRQAGIDPGTDGVAPQATL